MPSATRSIRWNVEQAAGEFGVDRKTLVSRIRAAGIEPGKDGKFSTQQITAALFGDLKGEILRKTKEEADKLGLSNQRERRNLAETPRVLQFCSGVAVVIRLKVLASSMTTDEKDEILAELMKLLDAGTVTEQIFASPS